MHTLAYTSTLKFHHRQHELKSSRLIDRATSGLLVIGHGREGITFGSRAIGCESGEGTNGEQKDGNGKVPGGGSTVVNGSGNGELKGNGDTDDDAVPPEAPFS
jgi:hypothetical protein